MIPGLRAQNSQYSITNPPSVISIFINRDMTALNL